MTVSGQLIWRIRNDVVEKLRKLARATLEQAEDAGDFGMTSALEYIDEISDGATSDSDLASRLYLFLKLHAERELRRQRRIAGKTLSLNAPLDKTEKDSAELVEFATYDKAVNPTAEEYTDAMKIVRASAVMCDRDKKILMCMVDGLTAEGIAIECRMSSGEARNRRAQIIRLLSGAAA